MPASNLPTLLTVIQQRFGVSVDPDSNGGQILNSLTPNPILDNHAFEGQADVAPLTFVPTASGVSVRAAQGDDVLVFSVPAGPLHFTLVPPDAAHPLPQVELTLLPLTVPVPFLRPAQPNPDGTLQESGGKVELHFPDLLLVVTASTTPPASAHLAPSHDATGAQEVTMTPPFALIGPDTVLGFGFDRAILKLDGPGEQEISVPNLDIYVAPPGIPALAMHGTGHDLHLFLGGSGGLSGDFSLALADGEQAAARPRFLHNLAAHLLLNHNAITLLELTGQIDIQGEVNARLGSQDGSSSQIDYTLSLRLDNGWQASLILSESGGQEYLWRINPKTATAVRNTLGAYAVFTPLLMPTLPGAGSSGYVDLALSGGIAAGLAASGSVSTVSVTLYGGELKVRQLAGSSPEVFLFFDLETELNFTVQVDTTKLLSTRRPIKVRHKAIGLRLDFGSNGGSPQLKPVFDPTQGFSLDLSDPGMFDVPEPLGDIVQPEGARMARENPLNFEIDLVLKADLGVMTVDRASVRIPLDPPAPPTLTALGAHINVPAALSGSGYLKLEQDGSFDGSLDVSLPALGVRVSASLQLENAHDNTTNEDVKAVLVGLGVEFPIPIPLANSGLGLFGFLGLFAMHFARNQPPPMTALDWFVSPNLANGDARNSHAWKAVAHNWALGLGTVIGTIEGGFLIHAKGMVVIELPGPRLLLVMNADILSPRPDTSGTDTGKFLAVIEIRPDSLTIGIVADYDALKPLLSFRVPVQAYFNFAEPKQWHLDVGGIPPKNMPVSVKFLSVLRADGYLLIHGDGIPDFPLKPPLSGFSVAAGIRAAFTWGPEDIGLYLKVTAQADIGISFKPFLIIGKMSLSGELHLFIIGIEASASADVLITPNTFFISARVCGSVDFFFFEVGGCVKLELGTKPTDMPHAEPLVRALSLHSRSPALLAGSATDSPVDGSLGNAAHADSENPQWIGDLPSVPIDAIPVLQMEMRMIVDAGCTFLGHPLDPLQPENAWVRRGERFYRYTLKSLDLSSTAMNGAPLNLPVDEGDTPTVWWDRYGKPHQGDDNEVQLALLSWIPDPTPAAAERTTSLDERTKRRWGDVCANVAGPASILWTFRQARIGPSPSGWTLQGQPSPDPVGAVRSSPVDITLHVTEPWRSGNPLADGVTQAIPAYVSGVQALPEHLLFAPQTSTSLRPVVPDDEQFVALFEALQSQGLNASADALRLNTHGLRKVQVLLFLRAWIWSNSLLLMRALDDAGNATNFKQAIDSTHTQQISSLNDLPPEWIDASGPWLPSVEAVLNAWFQVFREQSDIEIPEMVLVLVEADLPEKTGQIEIGLANDVPFQGPNWGLLIVEGLPESEVLRVDYDEAHQQGTITTINGALHADQSKRALLHPNSVYTVSVEYDVEVTDPDDKGQPLDDKDHVPTKEVGKKQQFRFNTDAQPPVRLDPWVLTTDPAAAEDFFFYGDPLCVIFATNATRKLYHAYGYDLFAVAKAASGNHPQAGPGLDPSHVKIEETVVPSRGIAATAMTPFESSLRAAAQACIDTSQSKDVHECVTLTMKLEPLTDYILDLQAQSGGQDVNDSLYPRFRRHFSTSRYASMQELAAAVNQTSIQHRRIPDATPLTALAAQNPGPLSIQVHDQDMEQTLRALRWGDLARPDTPRVVVLWLDGTGGAPPNPVALLLDTPEPHWRFRDAPTEVTDKDGVRRYQLQPLLWLDVIEQSVTTLVAHFLYSKDGGRTLMLLQPTARGGTLNLTLRRTHHSLFEGDAAAEMAPLATVSLAMAPWESQS